MVDISIVIPAYNAGRFLSECLDSILNQTFSSYEVIICDDSSSDDTGEIACSYCRKDSRFHYFRIKHGGAGAARNFGMSKASGRYYYFLDSDDMLMPDALEKLYGSAEAYSADIVVARSHYLDNVSKETQPITFSIQHIQTGVLLSGDDLPQRPFQSFVGWPWDKLFLADFIKSKKLYFQTLRSSNDALFVFLALCEASKIFCLEDDLFIHRTNNMNSLEHTRSKSWNNALQAIVAIQDELVRRNLKERYWVSFANWVSHFCFWNLSTLQSDALNPSVIKAFEDVLKTIQVEESNYYNEADYIFARLSHADRYEILKYLITYRAKVEIDWAYIDELEDKERSLNNVVKRLTDELELYKDKVRIQKQSIEAIKMSHSWRVGNALIRPLSFLKNKLKK